MKITYYSAMTEQVNKIYSLVSCLKLRTEFQEAVNAYQTWYLYEQDRPTDTEALEILVAEHNAAFEKIYRPLELYKISWADMYLALDLASGL
jgi:hypothetical protein